MGTLPTGTVTFLFTDIEGSTKLWERHREAMARDLARHDELLRVAITGRGGHVFKTVGDAFCAAFDRAADALEASLDAQESLAAEPWLVPGGIRVRMALHTGAAEERETDYFGQALNRVARLLSLGYGGQVIVSLVTAELLRDNLPDGVGLLDLGPQRLKDLLRPEVVYQVTHPRLGREFPPLKSLDRHPHNLPQQPTAFLGRDAELERVRRLLVPGATRVVTLTGPGGIGKTRLALQAAADLVDDFEDGVWFVDLSPVDSPDLVTGAIARTLGLRETGGRALGDLLRERLRAGALLLVLDNFEQLLPAVPRLVDLLAAGPRVKALVTSREALHVRGEQVIPVPPLAVPPRRGGGRRDAARLRQYHAVALFIERAVAVRPDFAVTSANAPAVAEICARLEGLPLAIELAAARIGILTPEVLLGNLASQLTALAGGLVDLPPRQRTLRATIDWSYRLLAADERRVLCELSVFARGADLESVERVCACAREGIQVLPALCSLVEKSLVLREEHDGMLRFRLMESIHEYGREILERGGGAEQLRDAHAAWFLERAERLASLGDGPEEPRALAAFDADYENCLAAIDRFHAGGAATEELRLCTALGLYWQVRGYFSEGRRLLERALGAAPDGDPLRRARGLRWAGIMARELGDVPSARTLLQESLRIFTLESRAKDQLDLQVQIAHLLFREQSFEEARIQCATVLDNLGEGIPVLRGDAELGIAVCLINLGELGAAEEHLRASGDLFRRAGSVRRQVQVTVNLVALLARQGRLAAARDLASEVVAAIGATGDVVQRIACGNNLAWLSLQLHDHQRARSAYQEMYADARRCGNQAARCLAMSGLADTLLSEGKSREAVELATAAVEAASSCGDDYATGVALTSLGEARMGAGMPAAAVEAFRHGVTLFEKKANNGDLARVRAGLERASAACGQLQQDPDGGG